MIELKHAKRTSPCGRIIKINNVEFGCGEFPIIAGPCAVESEESALELANDLKNIGIKAFRGGAYKPRTSPYEFQGLGAFGLDILEKVRKQTGLIVVTEVLSPVDVEETALHVDVLQVGTRNMQNFSLLKEIGKSKVPVILKRGMMATIEEWLYAAEYILNEGNENVILCERGIRTFEPATRNTLDLSGAVYAKSLVDLPVIIDPSHATGKSELVPVMSMAALACGLDGLLIEVHNKPHKAIVDGAQSINTDVFKKLYTDLKRASTFFNKQI